MQQRTDRRRGFTLVELIVVLAILATLAALTALYFPRFQEKDYVLRGADQISGWLLIAKQRAKRDGLPTGLRLYADQANGLTFIRRLRYIQQPDDVARGLYTGPKGTTGANAYTAVIVGVNLTTLSTPVLPGDYLECYGGGLLRRIQTVTFVAPNTTELLLDQGPNGSQLPDLTPAPSGAVTDNDRTNYRIILQQRTIAGEQELGLPDNVGVQIDLPATNTLFSRNLPGNDLPDANDSTLPAGVTRHYDILFAPSGAVISQNATNAQIIMWVRDLTKPTAANPIAGYATLITVQPRTGFIASHPAASGADAYLFTKDTRSSGM